MWIASVGVHDDASVQEVAADMDPMEREHMTALMDTSEIAADNTFLKAKVSFFDTDKWSENINATYKMKKKISKYVLFYFVILLKDRDDWLIFPDVVVDNKKKKGSKDIWPSEAQNWVISKVINYSVSSN